MVARRDVGQAAPTATTSFPAVSYHFPGVAVARFPGIAGDNRSFATGVVGCTGVETTRRAHIRQLLPARATPAPHSVVVILLRIARATNEHDALQPRVVEPHGMIGSRRFSGRVANVWRCWLRAD